LSLKHGHRFSQQIRVKRVLDDKIYTQYYRDYPVNMYTRDIDSSTYYSLDCDPKKSDGSFVIVATAGKSCISTTDSRNVDAATHNPYVPSRKPLSSINKMPTIVTNYGWSN